MFKQESEVQMARSEAVLRGRHHIRVQNQSSFFPSHQTPAALCVPATPRLYPQRRRQLHLCRASSNMTAGGAADGSTLHIMHAHQHGMLQSIFPRCCYG